MTFDAPWSSSLKWISVVVTLLMAGMSVFLVSGVLSPGDPMLHLAGSIPLLIVLIASFFLIRGYELDREGLHVQRLMWTTHIALDELDGAWADPSAMDGCIRLFGNGGLFSFTGLYRNKRLGSFRAFVTDPVNSVVLDWGRRKVVITPGQPERFVSRLRDLRPGLEHEPVL